ncbi:heavy metal sensor histidine kinase [Janthinobacterium agaricidamnosum]|uniref:Sensor protein n=1 Tax=Janthinobacterium agaricidamnosum NBRC 102515 = DSM 9628 TaxID=1349767 RepID=W0V864_9BURK|nr:heavy metal sensor histidine kinase [Janthinobacterium agaricidamnosum]CDG83815.1 heavy metal sensor kinase family protein [Janthinobacterium agaricidamnosum NBRC 102515 = DSM 9628]
MSKAGRSLTAQLGALFACVAVVVFSIVGFYLYQALVIQLQEHDDADLVDRVLHIRHLLEETPDLESIRAEPHRFLDAVDLRRGLLLVIERQDGRLLMRNTEQRPLRHARSSLAAGAQLSTADVRPAALANGDRLRLISAMGLVGASGVAVRVTLARTADDRAAVLAAYRMKVLAAAFAGAALTALFGFLLSRQGLRRVRDLAAQARQVSAHNLEMRLNAALAPAELRVLADSFNEVLDRLQSSFNNLSQFADDLAHDLRTPLNNLMVQTEVALSQPRESEEYQHLLSSNYEEFGRLARMVESMLFLARADHDQIALSTEALDAATELARIAEYFEGPASEAGVAFEIAATGEVLADAHLLRRAVGNLVANAVRYTPRGAVISLAALQHAAGTTIVVSNPGPGIDALHLPRLFDRFYRSDQSRSTKSSSAGLGLAIVKSIMALHGGSAGVSSTPGGVTSFSLLFPGTGRMLHCAPRRAAKTGELLAKNPAM